MEPEKNANCSVQALSTLVKSEKTAVSENQQSVEKLEEAKLFAKYPQVAKNMQMSQFLQKRLQQRKYFDSGDYNMAKAKGLKLNTLPATPSSVEIRTPRLSIIVDERDGSTSPTGIPFSNRAASTTTLTTPSHDASFMYEQCNNNLRRLLLCFSDDTYSCLFLLHLTLPN
ncbi:cAMP-regulated phosphoprotein [Trichinella spiralis]|uniref:cAMP-regulated phosphoprotein n=1 Tax=Trichinella spiralis TaxID=6334 RepID=A0ABR3KC21_TRISP